MGSSTSWVNDLRAVAGHAISVFTEVERLYVDMQNTAVRYHELKYETMVPPQAPPAISDQDALKQWLDETGAAGEYPQVSSSDYWEAALALNQMRATVPDIDKKAIFWVSSGG